MLIYIAGQFAQRNQIRTRVVKPLQSAGHEVTSRWLLAPEGESVLGVEELAADISAGTVPGTECLADIERAEAFVVLTDWPSSTGGYHVELGFALGLSKPITVVGPALNVFHALPQVARHASIGDFLRAWDQPPA